MVGCKTTRSFFSKTRLIGATMLSSIYRIIIFMLQNIFPSEWSVEEEKNNLLVETGVLVQSRFKESLAGQIDYLVEGENESSMKRTPLLV